MKLYLFPLFIASLIGCTGNTGPVSGDYQTNDGKLSAVVNDSSLFLMIGPDTMIIYDLKIHFTAQRDNDTFRLYKVVFSNSLSRNGYELFEIPLQLEPDLDYGGTLTALFTNDVSFSLGGYYFQRRRNEGGKIIFDNWQNLLFWNQETELRLKYPNE